MVKSMFGAIAGLRAHQSKMDVISNNIANVNTWGYKTRSANFQDAMYQNINDSTAGNLNAGGLGGRNASQVGYGVNMGSITTNFTSGSYGYTGRSRDCMINGTGFFIVGPMPEVDADGNPIPILPDLQDPNNVDAGRLSLSRVGIFDIDGNGYLVDDGGNYVYGFAPLEDGGFDTTQLIPIRVPQGEDVATTESISIDANGVITGINADKEKYPVGQIAVASVQNPAGLVQDVGYLYEITENTGAVDAIVTTAVTGEILANNLEMSNVDLATEMSIMITTQRGYQANSKIITVTDEMLEQLVNMKR